MRPGRSERGAKAWREGHAGEWLAALWLICKGYQILGFRLKTPQGEIDILARRGGCLAVVEVKRRSTIDEALDAIGHEQRRRLERAGESLARGRPGLRQLALRIDLIALAPGAFPRHVSGVFGDGGPERG